MIALELAPYRVEFRAPARDATGARSERQGAVLTLSGADGALGRGELAPLPGRSAETLDACCHALAALRPDALPSLAELTDERWPRALERSSALVPGDLPAARHALETALLDLCGVLQAKSAPELLAEQLGTTVSDAALPLAALVDADALEPARRQARAAVARGLHTLKLKVSGCESADAILGRVRELGALARLRLDANRSFSCGRTVELAPELAARGVEFLEEPVPFASLASLPRLPLPLAADESLLEPDFALSEARARGIAVIVVKPMVLGFWRALQLARQALAEGLEVVVSHSFDGPRAMAAARSLALALGPRRLADGLGPHAALEAWPEPVPGAASAPRLVPWSAAGLGLS